MLSVMCCIPAAASKVQAAASTATPGPAKRPAGTGASAGKDGKVQSYGDHEDSVYSMHPSLSPFFQLCCSLGHVARNCLCLSSIS